MKRYKKIGDEPLLKEIKNILEIRPTYGYKRVTAMINSERRKKFEKKVNRKRIYRIMDMNGLILKKTPSIKRPDKTGKIITLFSNLRWCSDGLEIHCFNGEKVFVAFSLDCHDRECLGFVAHSRPLLAKDIQNLMLISVENRFGLARTPREIQWLSDRGSIYRAHETVQFGRCVGLKSCFTLPCSPESNGMSEAFVGTLKRDYVYTSDCFDAKTVLKLLPKWIADYNEVAPHSGLEMMSPKEYQRSRSTSAEGLDHDGRGRSGQHPGGMLNMVH
jgi:putative transposase